MDQIVSFWLIPATKDRGVFQQLITELAQQYAAPVFVPHVTIYSGVCRPDEDPAAILAHATQGVQPLVLRVDRVFFSASFTKTLFVQFHPSQQLSTLAEALRTRCAQHSDYRLDPHLSLLYKHMSRSEKAQLAAAMHVPQATVIFDEVSAIASSGPTQSRHDVEQWQLLCQRKLTA